MVNSSISPWSLVAAASTFLASFSFRWAHEKGDCRTLLLSNGSLFWDPEVRRDAKLADVVKVSLHAWDQSSFERICRPHPTLRLDRIVEGYRKFREEFTGRLDCEVFIIPGIAK